MSRHRGIRNRQFSYDECDNDYYDDEEEYEEGTQRYTPSSTGKGAVSLSSYFDVPVAAQKQQQQKKQQQKKQKEAPGSTARPNSSDRHIPDSSRDSQIYPQEVDAELVDAVGAELEKRLGRDRFTSEQVRQAVVSSGYEVDMAVAILLSSNEPGVQFPTSGASTAAQATAGAGAVGGLPPAPGGAAAIGALKDAEPSSLAYGLSAEGQGNWGRKLISAPPGFVSYAPPSGSASAAPAVVASVIAPAVPVDSVATGLQPFDFNTPSPDDINRAKQSRAKIGGGARGGGDDEKPGTNSNSSTDGTSPKPDLAFFSSPKAKVVHISGLSPQPSGRKYLSADSKIAGGGKDPQTSPTPMKTWPRSPTVALTPSSQQQQSEADGDDREEEEGAGGKERLAMVVIGHVDAGKSTLMGQLLVQVGQVNQRALHKQEKEAKEAGKASFFLAWIMDEDTEERAHGVTIDVAQKYVETETKLVTVLDAPGHRDFIPKMISGTSAADAALLVIPATVGEFESGFQENGQTKEHAMLTKALGVNQVVVVVNKLDAADPPWSKERFEAVKAEVGPFLARTGFRPKKVRFVPASGLSGENVSKRDPSGPLSAWYDGPTLLEAIDAFSPAAKAVDKPFRMCVADVTSSGRGVSVSGRVVRGRVRAGDKVLVMPLEDPAGVTRLERNGLPARGARAGDNAEVTLSGVDAARVVVGNVLCKAGSVVPVARRFTAQIVALPALEVPVIKGTEFQLHMHNLDVMVHCSKLVALTNSAGEVLKARPRCIPSGSTAHIRITCSRPICLEKYSDCRALGRFVLRQAGSTVAVGLVLDTEARR